MSILPQMERYLWRNPKTDPIEWIESTISLSNDPTSASTGNVRIMPYQRRPILAQYDAGVRQVTIMAVEQSGKSACWRFPMVHKMVEHPGPRWIIYESHEKAVDINSEQFDPLMRGVPQLADQMNRSTVQQRRYNLPNGSILDFSGAGADITSKPKRDGVADELDTWPLTEAGIHQNLRNFKKRFRTFWARGEGCLVVVSSPSPRKKGKKASLTRSVIRDEFLKSDEGYWMLRCCGCGKLTMPSHAIYNLQWELTETENKNDKGEIIPGTITLECPKCGYKHVPDQAKRMNERGAYCKKGGKELTTFNRHVGCQWGALAAPWVFSWLSIAEAQMESGTSASIHAQADFFNSWRGLAFRPSIKNDPNLHTLRKKCAPLPDPKVLGNVFLSADTQDNGWYWVVRGVDAQNNLWHLAHGFVRTISDLKRVWDAKYLGIMPILGIIDEGGHGDMPKYVKDLVHAEKGLYTYKGASIGEKWRHGKNAYTILANAKAYKADLLYYIYSQTRPGNCYWYLPPESQLDDDYIKQILAIQPQQRRKHGDRYENWDTASSGVADHYFDCEKQMLVLLDLAYAELTSWRREVPTLRRGKKRKGRRAPKM